MGWFPIYISRNFFSISRILSLLIIIIILISIVKQVFFLRSSIPFVIVSTSSMSPTYHGFDLNQDSGNPISDIFRGDVLILQNKIPQVGDVIVFNASISDTPFPTNCSLSPLPSLCSTPVVHRIVAERTVNGSLEFATKGDHNSFSDAGSFFGGHFGWIKSSAIIGVVVFVFQHIGWFILFLFDPLILLGLVALLFYFFYKSFFSKHSKRSKKIVYLIFCKKKILLTRPNLFSAIIILIFLFLFIGIGITNYFSFPNQITPSLTNTEIIDSHSPNIENYTNLLFVNFLMNVSSSGIFNSIYKIEINAIIDNSSFSISNPTYVWTIVYSFAGIKTIHPLFILDLAENSIFINSSLQVTVFFKIFSTGLFASPIFSFSRLLYFIL